MGIASSLSKFSSKKGLTENEIIQELRQNKAQKRNQSTKKTSKIIPISISVVKDHYDSKYNTNEVYLGKRRNSDESLKSALTHPTILKYLFSFMTAQSTDCNLDFYLDALKILDMNRNRCYRESYNLWLLLVAKFILVDAKQPISMSQLLKNEIAGKLLIISPDNSKIRELSEVTVIPVHDQRIERRILEVLELAKNEVFQAIKEDSWKPFCESDIFESLLCKKEIRSTLAIPGSKDYFESVFGSGDNHSFKSSGKTSGYTTSRSSFGPSLRSSFKSSIRSSSSRYIGNKTDDISCRNSSNSGKNSRMSFDNSRRSFNFIKKKEKSLSEISIQPNSGIIAGSRYSNKDIDMISHRFESQELFETETMRENRFEYAGRNSDMNNQIKCKNELNDLNMTTNFNSDGNREFSTRKLEYSNGNKESYNGNKENFNDSHRESSFENYWEVMDCDNMFESIDSVKIKSRSNFKMRSNDRNIATWKSSSRENKEQLTCDEKMMHEKSTENENHNDEVYANIDSVKLDRMKSEKKMYHSKDSYRDSNLLERNSDINIHDIKNENSKMKNDKNDNNERYEKNVKTESKNEKYERRSARNSWKDNKVRKHDSSILENRAHLSAVALEKKLKEHFDDQYLL